MPSLTSATFPRFPLRTIAAFDAVAVPSLLHCAPTLKANTNLEIGMSLLGWIRGRNGKSAQVPTKTAPVPTSKVGNGEQQWGVAGDRRSQPWGAAANRSSESQQRGAAVVTTSPDAASSDASSPAAASPPCLSSIARLNSQWAASAAAAAESETTAAAALKNVAAGKRPREEDHSGKAQGLYTFKDGTVEAVVIEEEYPAHQGGGFCIFIRSLGRELDIPSISPTFTRFNPRPSLEDLARAPGLFCAASPAAASPLGHTLKLPIFNTPTLGRPEAEDEVSSRGERP